MTTRVPCTACGEKTASSEEQIARIRASAPSLAQIPLRPNICMSCALKDPAFRAEMAAWSEKYWASVVSALRRTLARPLEMIDSFVDGMK